MKIIYFRGDWSYVSAKTKALVMQVRAAVFEGDVIITGGEDARLCVWGDPDALELAMLAALSGPPADRTSSLSPNLRHSPY